MRELYTEYMEKEYELFFKVMNELKNQGVLNEIILIGSWCLHFYKSYFNNAPEIPILKTVDVDFLIPNPPKIKKEVNVPEILKNLDFIEDLDLRGHAKYIHPKLKVEFLIPDLGKGKDEPYKIKKLHISAQGLRYLNLLQDYMIEITYQNLTVKVPEPSAYVFNKFFVSVRRRKKEKREKDILTARKLGEFLLQDRNQSKKLRDIYNELPKSWQKDLKNILKNNSTVLYDFLVGEG